MRPVRLGGVDYEQLIHDALKTQPVTDSVERHPFGVVVIAFSQEESNPLNVRFIVQVLYGPPRLPCGTSETVEPHGKRPRCSPIGGQWIGPLFTDRAFPALTAAVLVVRSTSRHVGVCDQLVSRRNSAVFLCW